MTEFTSQYITQAITIAQDAARQAGNYLLDKLGSAKVTKQKALRDDLLDVDVEAEHIVLTKLRTFSTDIGILSEESGHEGTQFNYWIVDPLDGSANYQHGSPLFAVSIALVHQTATVGGVIYVPRTGEMFTAIRGRGAFLNDIPIRVSRITTLADAIAHIGDVSKASDTQTTNERLNDISQLVTHVQRIRMIGTAATDLAFLACGRADILVNHANSPWDIEAGNLLLAEAGGKVTTRKIRVDETFSIYSNGLIHQEAEKLLLSEDDESRRAYGRTTS